MVDFLWFLLSILSFTVILLLVKIRLLKKDLDEIRTELTEHLSDETNTLISSSSRDKHVTQIAAELNKQLCLLRKQRQQYLNGNWELKNAVTNISHDLRTPLTAICGYLDLLEQEEKSETAQRYIHIIRNRTDMLEHLTEELFCYFVIIAHDNSPVPKKVALNQFLEDSIAEFYAAFQERHIVPNIQMPETKIYRSLNPAALSRVLANLIGNAIQYSDGDLEIILSETGEITFTNTASCLNEVDVGKLFQRFYTVTAAKNSTGLGLSIARSLIEQMDGEISAEYEDNKLKIRILLPDVCA